ncbi:MAG: rRNA maturation RNase YbeY [Campylobacteraceae bacterium]|jgi:probable rRNA maturation factor|nr:rRNA maturation RNase YbeY [Campylobacteraceae bacterium]
MLIIENNTKYTVNSLLLEKIASRLSEKEIECVFINSEDMRQLNLKERKKDETTDVLSFPLEDLPYAPLGSIVINAELAALGANEFKHDIDDEIALLFIHGLLHLLGYDHECDNGQMRAKEEELIEYFCLPESLIIRTENIK